MTQFIGIVGAEAAKFTPEAEQAAKRLIAQLLAPFDAVCVSGHCHLGGVDIWAEEQAWANGRLPPLIFPPLDRTWGRGYRLRNLQIATLSDIVHVLVVRHYPPGYDGMRFPLCYHCRSSQHIKSGGCWCGWRARRLGKPAVWHTIDGDQVTSAWGEAR